MNETMNIYAKRGDKVVFMNRNGHDWQPKDAIECGLIEGDIYTVEYTDVGGWTSDVCLKEFPDKGFNTVMFRDAADDEN